MKIGDLVRHANVSSRGIVLQLFSGWGMYAKVYWLSHKHYGSHPADDLEVIK